MLDAILSSLFTSAGLFWKAFWALVFGYAFSSVIQVFISKKTAAKKLGDGSPKQLGMAALLGFISSSCSFAALSATRSLFTKGASLTSSLAYMFASTNLAVEVAMLAYVFLGWQYSLALFVGAPIIISVQAVLVLLTCPKSFASRALKHAKKSSGQTKDPSEGLPAKYSKKFLLKKTWKKVGNVFKGEWKMVYKELFVGFLAAGFVATLVPKSFFQALFPTYLALWLKLPIQALLAPVLAIITVIGSMGNGPLAAILANNGVLFGAIMAFLYADFNVPPAIKINSKYYGWPFASYLAVITGVSAIITGIVIHLLFMLLNILPEKAKNIHELAAFSLDYTFVLNILAFVVIIILLYTSRKKK